MKQSLNNFIFNHYLSHIETMTVLPSFRTFKRLKLHLLNRLDLNPFFSGLLTLLLGFLAFKILKMSDFDSAFYTKTMRLLGIAGVLYGLWTIIQDVCSGDTKKWIILHLHEIMPEKKQRAEVLLWRYNRVKEEQDEIELNLAAVEKEIKTNIKNFCEEQFGVSTSSFINFYQKKVLMGGEIFEEFLNYSLSIPRKKELGSESLRKILLAFKPIDVVMTDKVQSSIHFAFSQYSLEEIEKIFTSPHGQEYWQDLIDELAEFPYNKVYRIYDSFYEMKFDEERILHISSSCWDLNNKTIEGYEFKLLLTRKDYATASDDFSNCLRTYSEKWTSTIFRIHKGGKPYACIELYKNQIREVKGLKNKELNDPKLTKIIKSYVS